MFLVLGSLSGSGGKVRLAELGKGVHRVSLRFGGPVSTVAQIFKRDLHKSGSSRTVSGVHGSGSKVGAHLEAPDALISKQSRGG